MRPKRPLSMARLISCDDSWNRDGKIVDNTTPASSQALMILSHRLSVISSGFSTITCFPAFAAATAGSMCAPLGVQIVTIPEFQSIGTQVGQAVAEALSGRMTVDQALDAAQRATERTMRQAGYIK